MLNFFLCHPVYISISYLITVCFIVEILARALQALSDLSVDVSFSACVYVSLFATLMLNISETERFKSSRPIGKLSESDVVIDDVM